MINHIDNMNVFRQKLIQRRENLRQQRMASCGGENQQQPPQQQQQQRPPLQQQQRTFSSTREPLDRQSYDRFSAQPESSRWGNEQRFGRRPEPGPSSKFTPFLSQFETKSSGIPGLDSQEDFESQDYFQVTKG